MGIHEEVEASLQEAFEWIDKHMEEGDHINVSFLQGWVCASLDIPVSRDSVFNEIKKLRNSRRIENIEDGRGWRLRKTA